jgi:TetR/AcrR family transcriptional repressor of nem operon
MSDANRNPKRSGARDKLLAAAQALIRERGFSSTSVDDLCAAAGVTKGAFFHHFRSKEDLGVQAAAYWSEWTTALFAAAPFHGATDPVDRILAYLDFRTALIEGGTAEFTCLLGTMIQEVHETSPAIRDAAFAAVTRHAATLESDFAAAIARHGAPPGVTAAGLALHTQAVIQGAFIVAKGSGDPADARATIDHLRRYVALLFGRPA